VADPTRPEDFDLPPSVQIVAGLAALCIIGTVAYLVLLGGARVIRAIQDIWG
jgi:hypothetical protein